MDTKSLKKQLGAAIAMVLVAAVALGSSTYAWFVSNSTVKATTVGVSAKSNSAYLQIGTEATSSNPGTVATASYKEVILYPAIWANTFTENGTKATTNDGKYQFESAYASAANAATEKADKASRFLIGDWTKAASDSYATLNTFHVGTGTYDGSFTNLKVTDFTVTGSNSNTNLDTAVRVLVTDGTNWVVVRKAIASDGSTTGRPMVESQSLENADSGVFHADKFGKDNGGDVTVSCYVYYDGSDSAVYSDNLTNINGAGCKVTLTFEATPAEYGKTTTGN